MQPVHFVAGPMPAWKAHIALAAIVILPLIVNVPPNVNVILTAALAVYVGCWRSVKSEVSTEAMTKKDAMRFPLVGSCVLVGLFLTFKFLPKDIVNMLLGLYFVAIGVVAITASLLPFLEHLCPERYRGATLPTIKIPYVDDPLDLDLPQAVGGTVSLLFCGWYLFKKHWFANNILGIAFSITGIEHLSLGSMHVGCILLTGLFFYDIFWVFCTPVMVTVAKSFDAPIKLLFPRGAASVPGGKRPMGMLGLGDIVIPGIFVALVLRYDYRHGFKSSYFQTAFWGYTGGLGLTIFVMNYFQAAQPALLYIVPAVLGCVFAHAAAKGEFKKVFEFSEQDHAAATAAPAIMGAEAIAADKKHE
jgi:minor histocompatibility antigen H13